MFAQISPSVSDASESSCTLQFASRVRTVQLGGAPSARTRKGAAQQQLTKLLKLETSLQEKETIIDRHAAEARQAREELALERSTHLSKLAALQTAHSERVRSLEQELAKKVTPVIIEEAAHLQALLRAKEREIAELKTQQRTQATLPSIPRTVTQSTRTGANLLDTSATVLATVTAHQDEEPMTTPKFDLAGSEDELEENDTQSLDAAIDEKENMSSQPLTFSTSGTNRKRLSGSKRKETCADDAAAAAAGDSIPLIATTSLSDIGAPLMKKMKAAPSTPGKILAPLTSNSNIQPIAPVSGGVLKKTIFKPLSSTPKSLPLTPRIMAKSKVALAWKNEIPAVTANLNDSFDDVPMADVVSTPISSGKTVRFGGTETKFISPSPSPFHPSTQTSIIVPPANIEALRVKARPIGVKGSTSSISGGAKRQVVKSHSAPAWNNSFK